MLLPVVYLVIRALGAGGELWTLLLSARTATILLNSLLLAVSVTGASVALALPLAWLTVRTDLPLGRFWSVVTVLPLVIPSYIGAFTFLAFLGPTGTLQGWLGPFGVQRLPEFSGFFAAWLVLTLLTYPYALLNIRGTLAGMDGATEEVSRSLGHGPLHTFFHVILPQTRPALAAGALLVTLYTLSDFGAVSLLRFDTFTRAIYVQYQGSFDRTLAAGLALVLVAITLLILLAEGRTRGRGRYYVASTAAARPLVRHRLGGWRWPSLAFCALISLIAIGIPVGILLHWVLRGLTLGEPLRLSWSAAGNAVYASGIAAAIAAAAAIPAAFLIVRFPGRFSTLLERVIYSGFALPGIVMALSLVFFGARYAPLLYQTLALLVLAYVVRFLPEALGTTRGSLVQVTPAVEEAARSLGRSPLNVITTVTLPLIRSGVLMGAALVFLTAMKELPATLLLSPIGFETLATQVWAAADQGFFTRAAAPSLLLVGVSAIPVALLLFQERRARPSALTLD